jgi:DNA-directed RNA polymerase specialized sigma24 family protein
LDNLDNKINDQYYSSIKSFLRRLGCQGSIFEDMYQESLFILLEKEKNGSLDISNRKTYITIICMNLWFKEKKRLELQAKLDEYDFINDQDKEPHEKKLFLVSKHMKNLSKGCRDILNLYIHNHSEEEISIRLNMAGPKAVNNKKNYCKDKLRKMVLSDPLLEEVYE